MCDISHLIEGGSYVILNQSFEQLIHDYKKSERHWVGPGKSSQKQVVALLNFCYNLLCQDSI